jgi:hypothetical protein
LGGPGNESKWRQIGECVCVCVYLWEGVGVGQVTPGGGESGKAKIL